ncbi:MAG: hypothetical protein ABFD54_05070 [Armatimonadota bacterium]|nr:hypothetical protein [bacterium]
MSILRVSSLTIIAALLLIVMCLPLVKASAFSDNFDRPDTPANNANLKGVWAASDVGLDWIETASGNSSTEAGALTAPDIHLNGGRVEFDRMGWGPNGYCYLKHTLNRTGSLQADLYPPMVVGGSNIELYAYNQAGGFALVRLYRGSNGTVNAGVALSQTGAWNDWIVYGQDLGNLQVATCKISTDGTSSVTSRIESNGSLVWSKTMSGMFPAFYSATLGTAWESWSNTESLYADNFIAELIPDPYQSTSPIWAKSVADYTMVRLTDATVSARFYGDGAVPIGFAVQGTDHCGGIRVVSDTPVNPGDKVIIEGTADTASGERIINANYVGVTLTGGAAPTPVFAANKATGGGDFGRQAAVADDATTTPPNPSSGLSSIGMLMKLSGNVTAASNTGSYAGWFYIDDGSGLKDGSGNTGIMCRPPAKADGNPASLPSVGDYVAVTGVMGVRQVNGINTRYLWSCGDINVIRSIGKPMITDQAGAECPALADGSTDTGITVSAGTYTIRRYTSDEIVSLDFYITAQAAGSITVTCGDVMPLTLSYAAGSQWYKLRIPYSTAQHITVTWSASGATWNELQVSRRSMLPTRITAGTKSASVSLSGVGTTASCDIPAAFNCNWFEHGVVDGIAASGTRDEMIQRFHEFGAKSIRFPGGGSTYGYPLTRETIPAWQTAISVSTNYGIGAAYGLWNTPVTYASPDEYFRFCKDAGITAWFELNPGYWYDAGSGVVRKVISMDLNDDGYTGNYVTQASNSAAWLARLAKTIGVDVVWEIGNEDYCYYTPATYALLCKALINGVRAINSSAKIAVCGDSYSWSDYSWHTQLIPALSSQNVTNVGYSSEHFYMQGVGVIVNGQWTPLPWDTPQNIGDSMTRAWSPMRNNYISRTNDFNNNGLGSTRLAVTEYNVCAGSMAPELEHSAGRALGEAEVVCAMQKDGASIFFHDLVRDDPNATFFARLDYYPSNPAGKRLFWYPEGAAVGVVNPHGEGKIIYNSGGICVSNHVGFVYITIVNRASSFNDVSVTLNGASIDHTRMMDIRSFRASSPDACFFDYYTDDQQASAPASGQQVTIESAPYSVVGVKVYLTQ